MQDVSVSISRLERYSLINMMRPGKSLSTEPLNISSMVSSFTTGFAHNKTLVQLEFPDALGDTPEQPSTVLMLVLTKKENKMETVPLTGKQSQNVLLHNQSTDLYSKWMAISNIIPEKEFLVEDRVPLLGSSHVFVDVGYGHQEVVLVADENSC